MSKTLVTHLMGLSIVCMLALDISAAQAGSKPIVPEQIPGATNLSAEDVVEKILSNPEMIVIDSRKNTEYVKGHIEGAVNILNTGMTQSNLAAVTSNKSVPLLFYCNGHRCMRSTDAVKKALSWGYQSVFWFRGGWKEWTTKRLPIITK